ncbi:MAG: MFS transporter [Pseudomonadota bacterium]
MAATAITRTILPRTVIVLGLVSFLNDAASEMIAPLLPLFLTAVLGAGPLIVGLIEGLAEATASLLKLISGRLADRGWNQKRMIFSGYLISNTARPLIAIAFSWAWVILLRFLDRVGKGLRTTPRDAMIAGAVDSSCRGRAFGFHRAMDHAGAIVGPLAAFLLLQNGAEMREVFLWSLIPGVLLLLLLAFGVPSTPPVVITRPPPLNWKALDSRLRGMIVCAGGLAFAAAPEAFLVLWAQAQGLDIVWVPLLWAAAHAVKTLIAIPAGSLSDRIGRLPVVIGGWTLRVVILLMLALLDNGVIMVWCLFLAYAAALASTEGAERALIGDYAPANQKATAFGLYHMLSGLLALPGAMLFGALWQWIGMTSAFLTAAVVTGLMAALMITIYRKSTRSV